MAVAANRQTLEHDRRRPLRIDRPEAPTYPGGVLDRFQERQIHLAVKKRRSHLVFGSADRDLAARKKVEGRGALEPEHSHLGALLTRMLLDFLPFRRLGRPLCPEVDKMKPAEGVREFDQDKPTVGFGGILPRKCARDDFRGEQSFVLRATQGQFGITPLFLVTGQDLFDRQTLGAGDCQQTGQREGESPRQPAARMDAGPGHH